MSDLQAAVQPIIDAHLGDTFPACVICVKHQGHMVLHKAWGHIDPETQRIPVTTNTLFDLASVSKLFTATAFLSLVSAGRVQLDDPLVSVIPEFGAIHPRPIDGGQDPHSKQRLTTPTELVGQTVDPTQVTFRHLLTHTSGLPPWRDVYNTAGPAPTAPDIPDPLARAERWAKGLRAICNYPFVNHIGAAVLYSDIGLLLIGEVVNRLHGGGDLAAAVEARVINLLGEQVVYNPVREHSISRERIAPTEDDSAWRQRRAWGEVHDENACGIGGVAGHAGLFGTAQAVAALGQAWLDGANVFHIDPALAAEAKRQHAETNGMRRGLGFMLRAVSDSSAGERMSLDSYGHTGFTGTSIWIDPHAELVVACLTNSVYPGRLRPGTHQFRRAIHDAVFATLN